MSDFRRNYVEGGTYFFTLVSWHRRPLFVDDRRVALLREAMTNVVEELPMRIDAAVILPDHVHLLATLPPGDSDFSKRLGSIKRLFTRSLEPPVAHAGKRRDACIWQKRFWEHTVRSVEEFSALANYIHWNPVKHGYTKCPHAWAWSSFARWVDKGWIESDWGCQCEPRTTFVSPREELARLAGE